MSKLYDVAQTAELLGVKESTIRKWVMQRRIPFVKLGQCLRFEETVIEKIQKEGIGKMRKEGD